MKIYQIAAALCVTAGLAYPQAQISSGDVKGTVVDANGAGIAGAGVTVFDPARGITRLVTADGGGEYRVPLLPPGIYRLRVEARGFNSKVLEGVRVRVGDTVALPIQLDSGIVATEVVVTAEIPVVETERTQQATTIDSQRLANLPINRRNYLDFALLAPGVVETNDMVDGTDFRVPQSPHSGLSFGGGNGRGNMFSIDGVENYSASGGVRPGVSQETVQEFQINRNSFTAEFGGALGGVINIVTKSGTNDFHGSLFGFLRHRNIQARNFFDSGKSDFTRGQYGATVSAPVKRDRTFLFASFERLDRRETTFVPLASDRSTFARLTPSQQQLADFFDTVTQFRPVAAWIRDALITNNYPRTVDLFRANAGNFPFLEGNNQVSVRIDHQFNARHSSFLRGSFTRSRSENAQFGALIAFNRGRSLRADDATLVANHIFILRPGWISETRAQFAYYKLAVDPTDPFGPEINITGFGFFGREIFQPFTAFERHYQFQQIFSHSAGRHNFKFGADVDPVREHVRSETFFGGRFSFGESVPLATVLNMAIGDPNFSTNLIGTLNALGQQRYAASVLAPITAIQTFNLGAPTMYQQGFGDPDLMTWQHRLNFFLQDTFKLRPNMTLNLGVRYELEGNPKPVNTDTNNVAPRIGFAWTHAANGKTVIRGGYGIYYSHIGSQVNNLPLTLNGTKIAQAFLTLRGTPEINDPRTGRPLTSADVYQTLLAQGVIGKRAITREDLQQFGLRPGPNSPGRVIFGIVPDFVNPYAQQASLEVERAIGPVAVSAAYMFNRGTHIVRNLDRNLFYAGRRPDNQPIFGFRDPAVLQYNVLESGANSFYHALVLQVSQRFQRHIAFNAHYTFSKAIDEVTDFNSDFQPHDQLNARADRALSSFHQKHRFVTNAVLESPWRAGRGRGFRQNLLGDFLLSPIVSANSYRPFNILSGFDNLNDNHPNTHRPLNAGRNIGKGPNFFTFDLRLSRKVPLGTEKRRHAEFIAEAFNLLNRTNFKTLNNTVGDVRLEDLPKPLTGIRGVAWMPLAFTSAFNPRQFQFGVKVTF